MFRARTWFALVILVFVSGYECSAAAEENVIGAWEYDSMDDLLGWMDERPWLAERKPHVTSRIVFRRDHKVVDLLRDRAMTGGRWMTIATGTWFLEGDTIVVDHQP